MFKSNAGSIDAAAVLKSARAPFSDKGIWPVAVKMERLTGDSLRAVGAIRYRVILDKAVFGTGCPA